jgi:hypothetical protein
MARVRQRPVRANNNGPAKAKGSAGWGTLLIMAVVGFWLGAKSS